jgi:hypothetical protein
MADILTMALSKFEKRLSIIALVFVAVYIGAAALTIHSRITKGDRIERLGSEALTPGERQLMLVELLLPMLIVLVLTVCFIIVRKQRAKKYLKLDESEDEFQ